LSFLLWRVLHDMVKCISVEYPEQAIWLSFDRCSSRCIVQKSQLSKDVTRAIFFQELGCAINDLVARESTWLHDIELISWRSFLNDGVALCHLLLVHGINNHSEVVLVQAHKHESVWNSLLDFKFYFFRFWDHFWLVLFLNMIFSKDFSTHTGSGSLRLLKKILVLCRR